MEKFIKGLNKKQRALGLIFLMLFSMAFLNSKQPSKKGEQAQANDSLYKKRKDYFLCMSAYYEYLTGDYKKALFSFKKLLSNQNVPLYAYDGYLKLLFNLNQFQEIVKVKENKGLEELNNNLDIQIIFALSYLNLNQAEKADKILTQLLEKYPDDEQVAYYATIADIKNNKLKKALQFISKCVKRPAFRSKKFVFYFLESKIYMQLGEPKKALDSINKSLKKYKNFGNGWLLKALLEEQLGSVNAAIEGYEEFLRIVGRDLSVEKQLVSLLFRSNRFRDAADMLRRIGSDSPQYYFDLALVEWKAGNYDSALDSINKSIEKLPDFKRAKTLKIEILLAKNKKQEVLDFLQDWLKSSPQDDSIIHLFLLLKKVNIENNKIIKILETVLKDSPNSIGILSALADLYLEEQNYKKIVTYCKKLVEIVKDDELKSKILFQIGYIYFVTNSAQKVELVLNEAMKYKPTYPSVYNLLAYFYAKTNKNLNKALELCDQALKSDPNCYYYLDTKGYVLLKLGNVKQAIELFEKALALSTSTVGRADKIVLEHLQEAKR
jgi:predicted Zn-dependent protease